MNLTEAVFHVVMILNAMVEMRLTKNGTESSRTQVSVPLSI